MVKITAQSAYEWMVWDTKDVKHGMVVAAHIHKCEDRMMGKARTFYRVDRAGMTFETMISTKREAIQAAKRALKGVRG